jgi:hypothetical protein
MNLNDILNKFSLNGDYHNGKKYNNGGTDKNTVHSYVNYFYEDTFQKYKDQKISLLEIGIQGGASLRLWKEYFLESEKIIGIDISEDNVHPNYKNIPGVTYIYGDAYSDEIIDDELKFDIIIDDGPHTLDSQIKCIIKYLPKLNTGGILVIEDVQNIKWIDELIKTFQSFFETDQTDSYYEIETFDLRTKKNRYDDIIFTITKT